MPLTTLTRIAFASICFLLFTHRVIAEFTAECRKICLDPFDQNILLTECTIDGSTKDNRFNGDLFQWSEFDLNHILALSGTQFVFRENGNFMVNDFPCNACFIDAQAVLICICGDDTPLIGLNQNLFDVVGDLCFIDADFGPICGKPTTRRC